MTILIHIAKGTRSPRSCISAGLPGASRASLQALLSLGPRERMRETGQVEGARAPLYQGDSFVLLLPCLLGACPWPVSCPSRCGRERK